MTSNHITERIQVATSKLSQRQRALFIVLVQVVLLSVFINYFYKPQAKILRERNSVHSYLSNQLLTLQSHVPDIRQKRNELKLDNEKLNRIRRELSALESQLPAQARIPQLLGEFVHQASGYDIDFISIRPQKTQAKETYAQLLIEIIFSSSFADSINYLHRLESLSQFLNTDEVIVEQTDEGLVTTLLLSTLLADASRVDKKVPESVPLLADVSVTNDPFAGSTSASASSEGQDLHLLGIIYGGDVPTAIINDEVYRVGDEVGHMTVEAIERNQVVLKAEAQEIILTLEK